MRTNRINKLAGLIACLLLLTVGALAQDERAQAVLKQARAALGGTALEAVQSLAVTGTARHFARGSQEQVFEEQFELNFLLPDKFLKITTPPPPPGASRAPKLTEGLNGDQHWLDFDSQETDVIFTPGKPTPTIAFRAEIQGDRRAEWARYLLAFLLATPADFSVEWSYAGKAELDGQRADALEVKGQAGFAARLLFDEQSHLPLLLSYKSEGGEMGVAFGVGVVAASGAKIASIPAPPPGAKIAVAERLQLFEVALPAVKTQAVGEAGVTSAEVAPGAIAELEMQMRFAEYRSVNGVQLPHRLTITANGQPEAEWDNLIWLPNTVFPPDHFQPRKK